MDSKGPDNQLNMMEEGRSQKNSFLALATGRTDMTLTKLRNSRGKCWGQNINSRFPDLSGVRHGVPWWGYLQVMDYAEQKLRKQVWTGGKNLGVILDSYWSLTWAGYKGWIHVCSALWACTTWSRPLCFHRFPPFDFVTLVSMEPPLNLPLSYWICVKAWK